MKLVLVQPPIRDFYDTDIRLQPLGLCLLKAVVKRHLPEVKVIVKDYHQGYGRRTIPCPSELRYLKSYYSFPDSSPFSTFHHFYHFGATFEDVAREVAQEKPDVVGISSLFSPYYREALDCARHIKKALDVPILMGGSHVSASPLSTLLDQDVDFIIRGEGERPLVELLKALLMGRRLEEVPNLGYKRDGKPLMNPLSPPYDIDDLPFADFSDLPRERYGYGKKPLCFLTTSRGCPHKCAFCSVHLTFGNHFRKRTPEKVLSEMKQRHAEGYRVFDFEDDNLTFDKEAFSALLKGIVAEFPQGSLDLLAMNGISYLSLDQETLALMKTAGFIHLNISLVSSSETTLSSLNRPHNLKKYLQVVDQAHSLGFEIVSYQIVGLPNESLEEMIATMGIMARLPVLIGVSIFYITPGCPMTHDFPNLAEEGLIRSRSTAMAIETDHFQREDLYTLFITARILNFLKGLRFEEKGVNLEQALSEAMGQGRRGNIGAELIMRLFREKKLYAFTRKGPKPLSHFRADLFFQVWEKTGYVSSRQGTRIGLSSML